ncbi:YbjQ family protein [Methanonatronarchaeum sp. AMET6-2]|uniref:YbjQ family protein n=1 Tax=Methanonatronarchaeum sp. AMET6-2 TaxID=2933293 RepID=UPI0011FA8D98|nr:YbjQ family protein [Methanonatronarchaeum sp. AMET6-2]RZN62384.1 MAG: YbjQ family protein [Methanonatronarchaeia archaeon]UOY09642.1 YbjQ family protein [Methanonatronarchaeum sp. AMET6-2]
MCLTTVYSFPDSEVVEDLGVVRGNTIRARHIGRDITQAFRNLIGGELKAYTELYSEAREEAIDRMVKDAERLDADAIINIRFMTSMIAAAGAEIMAYGTAVKLESKKE